MTTRAWCLLLAGCWTSDTTPPPIRPSSPPAKPDLLTITEDRFGPIDSNAHATVAGIRALFPGYHVVLRADEGESPWIRVSDDKEELLFVVPNDDGTVFNVHATSGRVSVAGRPWRVGAPFHDGARLTTCDCWGQNPTCWISGEHIAVNFDRDCFYSESPSERAEELDGLKVQRIIWNPTPFGPQNDVADPANP